MRYSGYFAEQAKTSGKRSRTRAALLDAAVSVIAQQGVEGASVNEIAREAGVANGTFYLHFQDKDDIMSETALAVASRITRRMDKRMVHIENAIDRVVCGTRSFLHILFEDSELALAVLNAFRSSRGADQQVVIYLRSDIKKGCEQGVFSGPVDDFLVACVGGVTTSALSERLAGAIDQEAGQRAAELQLRMLGVNEAEAKRAAWQPLVFAEGDTETTS